ncbi:hypothetical protein SAMD00019534_062540 [Acytostelium subglobosum LB1]|uniref:hypothetical protein n=1 Tax=Acytostelium subglobosum LB1 TaxID=1410327 RepID=UPI0006449B16|nr:hypothetical protein SAMD00019534_062540 [Acytostelium subglobosum LB1]GAM23079.1 hypothetical protein SAMD00019534_062540 [Acytostelium subglobosum LB1]|eukprot:XP_012754306.1 hypothetical protein SAMD00019534_062540 [Acytostelium subglobosum LB1]
MCFSFIVNIINSILWNLFGFRLICTEEHSLHIYVHFAGSVLDNPSRALVLNFFDHYEEMTINQFHHHGEDLTPTNPAALVLQGAQEGATNARHFHYSSAEVCNLVVRYLKRHRKSNSNKLLTGMILTFLQEFAPGVQLNHDDVLFQYRSRHQTQFDPVTFI